MIAIHFIRAVGFCLYCPLIGCDYFEQGNNLFISFVHRVYKTVLKDKLKQTNSDLLI